MTTHIHTYTHTHVTKQTLWINAPKGHVRDKQVMVLGLDYLNSSGELSAGDSPRALVDSLLASARRGAQ